MLPSYATAWIRYLRMLWHAEKHTSVDSRRAQRALMLGSAMLTLQCFAWGVFFALESLWLAMTATLIMLGCSIGTFTLIDRYKPGSSEVVRFGTVMTVVALMTVVLDAPTEAEPNSTHLFFLPLAVAAFIAFREARAWLSTGLAAVCLGLFFALAVASWNPLPGMNLSDEVRSVGKWFNGLSSMGLLLLLLHVLSSDAKQQASIDKELQAALQAQQFVLYFQPQLDQNARVTGAEVLLRWQHPQRGLLPPSSFIDHAERNGLMVPLGQWVLERACEQLQAWQHDPLLAPLELAVNVSQTQFRHASFASDVLQAVQRYGIAAQRLELELTETLMVLNMDELQDKMHQLQQQGLRFSLDDFGIGFSSLALLRQLPLHTLKIDRSFVSDLPGDDSSSTIVKSLLRLAQEMELTVVAEGIEQPAQHAFLLEHGCPRFQGFLYSKPLPLQEFMAFVYQQNTRPLSHSAVPPVQEPVAMA